MRASASPKPGRHGGRAETDAGRHEGLFRIVRDGVLVDRDVSGVEQRFGGLARDLERTKVDKHHVAFRVAGNDAQAALDELFGHGSGVLHHLLAVDLEGRVKGFAEGHGLGGDDVHERAALDAGEDGLVELLAELREMGVGVYATGGETADVGDLVRTIIVDSTVTCRMKRADVIDNANIRPGDVIVGLSSCGQATYEKEYNGGMGSNGLTSARHDVFAKYLAEKYPESYDKAVPEELVYSGSYRLDDAVEGSPVCAGKLVLSPTRTYAPIIKKMLDEMRPAVHGMVHCTGGAQTKVLHFVGENCRVVKDNMFPVPPLFRAIQEQSGTDWAEMYKVFNMGHRMEIYVSPADAQRVIDLSRSFNVDAQIVGHIEEGKKSLVIKSEYGTFEY